MKVTGNDLIGWMESWAPRSLAESWDHPGLQVGDPRRRVTKVLISLDLTEENVDLAVREGAEMVISRPMMMVAITASVLPSCTSTISNSTATA